MYKPHHIQARIKDWSLFFTNISTCAFFIIINKNEREYMLLNSSINDVTNRHRYYHSDSFPNNYNIKKKKINK
ncbi:hypothetical protein DERP_010037 [Dermatophagoides pteronyssinus]|uniref:Uncharacterized protein n=1 Tax=Dermatophagoides pteronyssinus TaxID=6956 RepID=A0ABQ8JER2_DERPT|nr:hypothetical protein DERP_010037 [Dermatophagoides pteronyssinus]